MTVSLLDWTIIIVYFLFSFGISIYFSKKAGKDTGSFFLSGRNLPWWIAGTSMVATTFAADTPLAVTELVAKNGIAGNWLWWNMVLGGILTVFFFARLWRRANIMTDAEFVDIRYEGKPAKFLRGFRAIYIGIFMNAVVIAWVNLAMVKILKVIFPDLTIFGQHQIDILGFTLSAHLLYVGLMMLFVAVYASLSGLMGVSITDSFQFVMAMSGSIALAYYAVKHIGGIDGLKESLSEQKWIFDFIPDVSSSSDTSVATQGSGVLKLSLTALFTYLGVQWWASWYPGAEPGGGGYIAQRMMSAKDEKRSLFATLWFNIAHYALRPWPWILAAMVALVMYPHAQDKGATYVMLIRDLLPSGLLGLMLAAFFAAYMSTIASQTVWGTSYIVNDLFKPFIKPNADEKYYVKVSRITTFVLMFFALIITTQLTEISGAWKFILVASGGIGLVLILRWFWWRVNAWSEITAMLAPYFLLPFLVSKNYGLGWTLDHELMLIVVVAWSTFWWLTVTFLTKPTAEKKLMEFYRKVHPGGIGWERIASKMPDVESDKGFLLMFANWFLGSVLVIFTLFGIGKFLFKEYTLAFGFFAVAFIAGFLIVRNMKKIGWKKLGT